MKNTDKEPVTIELEDHVPHQIIQAPYFPKVEIPDDWDIKENEIDKRKSFKELRKASGMNQTRFAEYFGIPRRSVQNWDLGLRECPGYLLRLMEYKLRKENIIK